MSIVSIISLFGGLAIFLFGMNIMGEGLEKQSGGKMAAVLGNLTASPLRGLLLGAGVTALIQSSSATTVMVVGFVNSGILNFHQSIGIIMGANIGTTVTSWLLSLAGLEGDSLIVQMLKPTTLAPIVATIGILLYMQSSRKKKDIGAVMLGFAILMTGMDTMSSAMKPLANVPEFAQILTIFQNPLLGILTGALLTAVIQSSSASIGILQALAVTGSITFGAAVPIVMGQNIGTCITAALSAIGANKNAKRVAVVHLLFNIIGTVILLAVFYTLHAVFRFSFMSGSINSAQIALVHTLFNVCSTAILFPMNRLLEKLAYRMIPEQAEDNEFALLDERFLATPSLAVEQSRRLVCRMAEMAKTCMITSIRAVDDYNEKTRQEILDAEEKIDSYEDKLGTYLVQLGSRSLSLEDSHQVSMLLHMIGDLERIGDHAVNMLGAAQEVHDKKIVFSEDAHSELMVITAALGEILQITCDAIETGSTQMAEKVEPLEQVIDSLRYKMKERHVARLQKGECTIDVGFVFSDMLTNIERVSDHCSNLAVSLIQIGQDQFDTHEYLNNVKNYGNRDFREEYDRYKMKYYL